jgi:hypothetical protein
VRIRFWVTFQTIMSAASDSSPAQFLRISRSISESTSTSRAFSIMKWLGVVSPEYTKLRPFQSRRRPTGPS